MARPQRSGPVAVQSVASRQPGKDILSQERSPTAKRGGSFGSAHNGGIAGLKIADRTEKLSSTRFRKLEVKDP
jgi:hypothetical protein